MSERVEEIRERWDEPQRAMHTEAAAAYQACEDIPYLLDRLSETEEKLERALRAFQAAKDYIDKSPCDPDILSDQWEAWERYQEALQDIRDEEPT